MDEESPEEDQEAPVPLVTHVNNILHSVISNVKVYFNNLQIYNSNGLYVHKSYISNNFKGGTSDYKAILHCEEYNYQEFPHEIMKAPSSGTFFRKRMKLLSRPDSFILYGKLGVNFFSTSQLPYPKLKFRLQLIKARPDFYMNSDNPNVSPGHVHCSLYTRQTATKDEYHKKRMDIVACTAVEFNYLETLAKTFIIPARQNQFLQENILKNALVGCNEYKLSIYLIRTQHGKSILASTI